MDHLNRTDAERMAFGYCSASSSGCMTRFLLKEIELPADQDYAEQHEARVVLNAAGTVRYLVRATGAAAFLDAHSHPFPGMPHPSETDEWAAQKQYTSLQTPSPGAGLIRIIRSADSRIWASVHTGADTEPHALREIRVHGTEGWEIVVPVNAATRRSQEGARELDHRTLACLGETGLAQTRSLTVGVIGVGGVGSMVVRLLAGVVGSLIIIDPDKLEAHNAPRVWFAGEHSKGSKVLAAKRALRTAFPELKVRTSTDSFPSTRTKELLGEVDFLFVCPDHNAVRYAASRFAAHTFTPLVEVGCGGRARAGVLSALGYHVRLQTPGGPCLACNGLDLSKLEDPSTTEEKKRIGYLEEGDEVAGELAGLTTRAAADAFDVFLRYCTRYAGKPPLHIYGDALHFKTLDLTGSYAAGRECPTCGPAVSGVLRTGGDRILERPVSKAAR